MFCVHLGHLPLCGVVFKDFQEGLGYSHCFSFFVFSFLSGSVRGIIVNDEIDVSVDLSLL